MHCRDITQVEFETIVAELVHVKRHPDDIESTTGQHEDYGSTILIRDATRCMVLVEDPSLLDEIRLIGLAHVEPLRRRMP